jgi:hypothetical protein
MDGPRATRRADRVASIIRTTHAGVGGAQPSISPSAHSNGLETAGVSHVDGFTTLRYAEIRDPEGVPLGLLDGR